MSHMSERSNLTTLRDYVTERAIRDALKETEGDVALAAIRLGVHRATVYRLMKRYGIEIRRIIA